MDGQGVERVLNLASGDSLPTTARQVLEYNRRIQRQNNAPEDFPNFVREGYDMTLLVDDGYQKLENGLIVKVRKGYDGNPAGFARLIPL